MVPISRCIRLSASTNPANRSCDIKTILSFPNIFCSHPVDIYYHRIGRANKHLISMDPVSTNCTNTRLTITDYPNLDLDYGTIAMQVSPTKTAPPGNDNRVCINMRHTSRDHAEKSWPRWRKLQLWCLRHAAPEHNLCQQHRIHQQRQTISRKPLIFPYQFRRWIYLCTSVALSTSTSFI